MKSLRTIFMVMIAVASAGLLLQCGAPSDLLGKVEEKVEQAHSVNTCTVTYHGNGYDSGSVPVDNNEYEEGDSVTVSSPGAMSLTGYTFVGWNTKKDGTGTTYFGGAEFEMRSEDIILYAQWSSNTYELTVSAGAGGSITTPGSPTVNIGHGVPITISADPNLGYTFDGWSVVAGSGVTIADSGSASTEVTLENGNATVAAGFVDNTGPNQPNVNGDTPTIDTTPTWTWQSGGGGNGTYRYKINDNSFSGDYHTTQYEPGSPLSEGSYTLYVQECDDAGNWSSSGSFTVLIEITPPSNPSPNNGGISDGTSPLLNWEDIDDASKYHVQVNTQSDFSGEMKENSSNIFSSKYKVVSVLTHQDITYFWRVRTQNNDGMWGQWSDTWAFSAEYTIGDRGPANGYVFYDDDDPGCEEIYYYRYLEAAPYDVLVSGQTFSSFLWGEMGNDINGYDPSSPPELNEIGTGYDNHSAIINALGNYNDGLYASMACGDYSVEHNGEVFSDWYLPSLNELALMYSSLQAAGLGNFDDSIYWSSTENDYGFGADYAYYVDFRDGDQFDPQKLNKYNVRAIRGFEVDHWD